MADGTGAMQQFEHRPERDGSQLQGAGLVLLYADNHTQLPAVWRLPSARATIGSGDGANVHLPVPAVSRVHAEIVFERGTFTLRDLGSTNGTLVDGRRVLEAPLEHGQELRFGDALVKFVTSGIEERGRYPLTGPPQLENQSSQLLGGYEVGLLRTEMAKVAATPLSIMLLGESGTGKEVAAKHLHTLSGRSGAFRAINCAALPDHLIESELFGYKRGAFTGAERDKAGIIRAASGGTLLLDEIGDMPMTAQVKLLRVLQSKEVYPVGSTIPEPVDLRVLCATHRDLQELQTQDCFRGDLYARLNDYQVRLPPLRERKEDLLLLLLHFLSREGRPELKLSFQAMTALLHYDWPYNVRELEACAKRAAALCDAEELQATHLPAPIIECMQHYGSHIAGASALSTETDRGGPTEAELVALLRRHQGNIAAVGRELGRARMQVHRWLKRYELSASDFR